MSQMDSAQAADTLSKVAQGIQTDGRKNGEFNEALTELSLVVKSSLADESFREELAKTEKVWQYIISIIQGSSPDDGEISIRLKRGAILLARNLLVADRNIPSVNDELTTSIFSFLSNIKSTHIDQSLSKGCVAASLQCVFNHTVERDTFYTSEMNHTDAFLGEFKNQIGQDDLYLYFRCVNNIVSSSEMLVHGFKSEEKSNGIFFGVLEQFERLDFQKELSSDELVIISIFQKMIVHESFLPYITTLNEIDFVRFLKAAAVIITSKESWEVFELTVILSWMYELFQKALSQIKMHFNEVDLPSLEPVYHTIHAVLDVFSILVKFEHAKKFLLSYKGVENLVQLLGVIHKNVKPKKLKDSEREQNKREHDIKRQKTEEYYKNFPEIKSLIIETLSSIIYKDFAVQELVRETHGLELVLSNCIIDDNEPFIKERSIVCLRFLLLNNEKNQEFVAKLEAKEAVQDETLDNAGFEVEIVDGKVKLKQKKDTEQRVQTKEQNEKIHEL